MRVFITGMTGTLGTALAQEHYNRGDQVFGCSRNEEKCVEWNKSYHGYGTLYCCDCENLTKFGTDIGRLLSTMDRVYHCAAMKHVDMCEKNPSTAMYQNVALTMHIAAACQEENVPFYFVSSDKACLPVGVYGASKLMAEKATLAFGGAAVRFGNLIASSGSVFTIWNEALLKGEPINLTDREMTRFFYPVRDAVNFLIDEMVIGAVAIPTNMLAACLGQVAEVYERRGAKVNLIGLRPGETIDQWIIAPGDRVDYTKQSKYLIDTNAIEICTGGISSRWCKKWDLKQLLEEAGIGCTESGVPSSVRG